MASRSKTSSYSGQQKKWRTAGRKDSKDQVTSTAALIPPTVVGSARIYREINCAS